ncbi:MAG: sigma-54-dependent Fis family transcriptional regulator [Desulfosarcina sp.]|nr:sigma-54-dependent Fis family transcriptional regulator [Desulfobacterales bacterium]
MTSKNEIKSLLIIDDEENMRHMLSALLKKMGYRIDTATNGQEGLEKVKAGHYDYILCDVKMPRKDGMAFLDEARIMTESSTVIMMSAYGTIDMAIEAMKLGAYDFISKPFKPDEVCLALKKAEERESLKQENLRLKERIQKISSINQFGNMIGSSQAMKMVFSLAEKAAQYDTTVLVTGESGTGKELVARGIHYAGPRKDGNMVPVNCGGIPETLLESELFGYVKGAFTGADRNKKGLFQEADGGTIFLDEIGELPVTLQVKLLRVLQENEVRPVGDAKTKRIDVRVIAATSKDLEEEMRQGRFREDLFYRLNVLRIHLPPLRERAGDIQLLCQHFLKNFKNQFHKNIEGISPGAMTILLDHKWPGNVRELENMIERAVVLVDKHIILPENLPTEFGIKRASNRMDDFFEGFSLKKAQKIIEKRLITRALESTGGNRTQAAKLLEISIPSLLSKIKTYEVML